MILIRGRWWGTAGQLSARLGGDVTEAMVYRWRDPRRWDNPADALETIRIGRSVYSPLDQAATIEHAKRAGGRGRPRQLDAALIAA